MEMKMEKLLIVTGIILILIGVVQADINTDIDYYYNMAYPDTINRVTNASLGTWNQASVIVPGLIDNASKWVGSSSRLRLTNFNLEAPFSYSVWVRTNDSDLNGQFFGKDSIDYTYHYSLDNTPNYPSSQELEILTQKPSALRQCKIFYPINISDNVWHNLVVIQASNCTGFKFYLDGVLQTERELEPGFSNNETNMTYFSSKTDSWDIGEGARDIFIDEVGIWSGYELTQTDVNIIYNSSFGDNYFFNIPLNPSITIFTSLINNTVEFSQTPFTIYYNATTVDTSSINNCSLYVNGVLNLTDLNVNVSINQDFSYDTPNEFNGNLLFNITCSNQDTVSSTGDYSYSVNTVSPTANTNIALSLDRMFHVFFLVILFSLQFLNHKTFRTSYLEVLFMIGFLYLNIMFNTLNIPLLRLTATLGVLVSLIQFFDLMGE